MYAHERISSELRIHGTKTVTRPGLRSILRRGEKPLQVKPLHYGTSPWDIHNEMCVSTVALHRNKRIRGAI